MTDTAIIYASSVGKHVMKTAKYIAAELGADTFNLKDLMRINMDEYSHIIIGTPINFGKPSKKVVDFLNANREILAKKKVSLFICCMYSGDKGAAQCETVSNSLGIPDAVFFPDKSEKNEAGVSKDADAFIARMRG
ncbi:flavodoxin domain-containing protein [Methanomassiliicoccaceae archaeon COG_1]|nr:flavodoxin domain-containing protein [Methanomassiliicoccaceae archaeon COG_1]